MTYVWDSNILLNYIRNSNDYLALEKKYQFFSNENNTIASVVSMGEIVSLSIQLNWGKKKISRMQDIFININFFPIFRQEIIDSYAEIDAYSQNKHPQLKLSTTARNMGKNDLWIAATAHALQAKLVTTDKDFDHLHQVFLDIIHE